MHRPARLFAFFSALVLSAGAAGAQSVSSLREDLARAIDALPDTARQKEALRQVARAIGATLEVDTADSAALQATATGLNAAINCAWSVYPPEIAPRRIEEVSRHVVNSEARRLAHDRYNLARSGSVIALPQGNTCK